MASASIDFDAPDLAVRIEQLSQYELDRLPFGVILLDRDGTVIFYSETEKRQSGFGQSAIGQNFYLLSCFGKDQFRGRLMQAREAGVPTDLEFAWVGDFNDPKRELRVRALDSRGGGFWILIQRDIR